MLVAIFSHSPLCGRARRKGGGKHLLSPKRIPKWCDIATFTPHTKQTSRSKNERDDQNDRSPRKVTVVQEAKGHAQKQGQKH